MAEITAPLRRLLIAEYGSKSDAELLRLYSAVRDGLAFEWLVRRHGPMVFGVCRRVLRHDQDAEDAFQATFLVLAMKAASVSPATALAAWLHGVARRTALKAQARALRRVVIESQAPTRKTNDMFPDTEPILDAELARLPERYRLPIVLCDLEGQRRREVAASLGCSEGTLSARLTRGRRLLAERLRRRGVVLPAGGLSAVVGTPLAIAEPLLRRTALLADRQCDNVVPTAVAELSQSIVKQLVLAKLQAIGMIILGGLGFVGLAVVFLMFRLVPVPPPPPQELLTADPAPDSSVAKPPLTGLQQLVGEWQHTGAVVNGAVTPAKDLLATRIVISPDGSLAMYMSDLPMAKGRIVALDTTKTPHEVDVIIAGIRASDGQLTPEVAMKGIFAINKTSFQLCHTRDKDAARPTTFASPAGKDLVYLELKRAEGTHLSLGPSRGASHLAFTPDGQHLLTVVTSSRMGLIGYIESARYVLWDIASGSRQKDFGSSIDGLACALTDDGKTVAYQTRDRNGDYTCWLTTVAGEEKPKALDTTAGAAHRLVFSRDGTKLIALGKRGDCTIWNLTTKKALRWVALTGLGNTPGALALSPDGATIALAGTNEETPTVQLWDAATGRLLRSVTYRGELMVSLAFAPDGKTLAGGVCRQGSAEVPGIVHVWDVASLKERRTLEGHTDGVNSVLYTPDGQQLVSGSYDGTVRVWDANTGKQLAQQAVAKDQSVTSLALTADGRRLAVGGTAAQIHLWPLKNLRADGPPAK